MSQPTIRRGIELGTQSLTPLHWVATALAAATGVIHAWLYTQTGVAAFAFAAVVFVLAVLAMVYGLYRPVLYALGIPFTGGQVVLWFLSGMNFFAVGLLDKIIQSVLVVLLAYLLYVDWWVPRRTDVEGSRTATR